MTVFSKSIQKLQHQALAKTSLSTVVESVNVDPSFGAPFCLALHVMTHLINTCALLSSVNSSPPVEPCTRVSPSLLLALRSASIGPQTLGLRVQCCPKITKNLFLETKEKITLSDNNYDMITSSGNKVHELDLSLLFLPPPLPPP